MRCFTPCVATALIALLGEQTLIEARPHGGKPIVQLNTDLQKNQCRNTSVLSKFPKEIEDFASLFAALQEKRHAADYDPGSKFALSDVTTSVDAAELAIKKFQKARIKDRRAFAAWTTMKNRSR